MRNPIFKRPVFLLLYVAWWVLPGSIHFFYMWKTVGLNANIFILDSAISFGIFAILGLPIWFMVRYGGFSPESKNISIPNQLISMFVIFIIWIGTSYGLAILVLNDYGNIFINSILWRSLLFLPVYLILIAMYFLLSSMQIMKDQELQKASLEMLVKEAELNALKSQINPHFLFNSLNSATALTVTNPDAAREMIIKISDFFRFNLLAGKKQFVSLKQEIEQSLLYLEIEKGRFGDKILINCDLPIEFESIELPSLILQPIVENCVKHGVYESSSAVNISFNFMEIDGDFAIQISNDTMDGMGKSSKGTGTGLRNIADRLRLIYRRDNLLQLDKVGGKFIVKVIIPGD